MPAQRFLTIKKQPFKSGGMILMISLMLYPVFCEPRGPLRMV